MAKQRPDPTDAGLSAAEKASQLRAHESRFLKAMKLLIEAGKARTTEDLIRYAEQDQQTESVNYLRAIANERLPVDLAYDALSVNLRIVAHKRNSSVLQECQKRFVALVMPLPPHIIDAFISLMPVSILVPDGHHVPLAAQDRQAALVHGSRASREALARATAIVFEVFAAESGWHVDSEAADLMDSRLRDPDVLLIAHLRPHLNPSDIVLPVERGRIQLL